MVTFEAVRAIRTSPIPRGADQRESLILPEAGDRLAPTVEERWLDFHAAPSNRRKYPVQHFKAFWEGSTPVRRVDKGGR